MSLLSRLVWKNYSQADFDRDIRRMWGRQTNSGVLVNEESALRFITVFSCARVLAETMGSFPIHVHRERADGGADLARDHQLYERVHNLPNDEMTSQTWIETATGHMALSGNHYSILTHNLRGQVIDIYPVDWYNCEPQRNPDTGRIEYHINDRGKPEVFPASRVLHVPLWGGDGITGYSPIRKTAEGVGLGMAAAEFASRFYGQGMNMGIVIEHPGPHDEEDEEDLRQAIEEKGAGLENSWRPVVLYDGAKLNRIPMPMKDAQFIETRKLSRDEICGLFRVPPHMIGNLDRATFSNIENLSLQFVMYTMLPYITRWEKAMTWKLLSPLEREQGYYVKFNINGLLRGDAKTQAEVLHLMRQDGVVNADQWLSMLGMNPQEGGYGKVFFINGNMVPIDQAGKGRQRGGKGGDTGNESN